MLKGILKKTQDDNTWKQIYKKGFEEVKFLFLRA